MAPTNSAAKRRGGGSSSGAKRNGGGGGGGVTGVRKKANGKGNSKTTVTCLASSNSKKSKAPSSGFKGAGGKKQPGKTNGKPGKKAKKEPPVKTGDRRIDERIARFKNQEPTPIAKLGHTSEMVTCPFCGLTAMSNIKGKGGVVTWIGSVFMRLLTAMIIVPTEYLTTNRIYHRCSGCNEILAKKRRLGRMMPSRKVLDKTG